MDTKVPILAEFLSIADFPDLEILVKYNCCS